MNTDNYKLTTHFDYETTQHKTIDIKNACLIDV